MGIKLSSLVPPTAPELRIMFKRRELEEELKDSSLTEDKRWELEKELESVRALDRFGIKGF